MPLLGRLLDLPVPMRAMLQKHRVQFVYATDIERAQQLLPNETANAPWVWLTEKEPPSSVWIRARSLGALELCVKLPSKHTWPTRIAEIAAALALERKPFHAAPARLLSHSHVMQELLVRIEAAARSSMPVLIVGETGTGKEETALRIHELSSRSSGPYIAINCAAIPNELMESELFGHSKGSFSGAIASVDGKLVSAHGGTVFLDEVHDMPLSIQTKLLRVLEDHEVTRLGETRARKIDFRIIAATNIDLKRAVNEGRFGRDFYERLSIVDIETPALRERKDDIPLLVEHFIARFYELEKKPRTVTHVSESALHVMMDHSWPGNVRELRNVVFQALAMRQPGREDDTLMAFDFAAFNTAEPTQKQPAEDAWRTSMLLGRFSLKHEVENVERRALRLAFSIADGSASKAARLLGEVGRGTSKNPEGTVRAMRARLGVKNR